MKWKIKIGQAARALQRRSQQIFIINADNMQHARELQLLVRPGSMRYKISAVSRTCAFLIPRTAEQRFQFQSVVCLGVVRSFRWSIHLNRTLPNSSDDDAIAVFRLNCAVYYGIPQAGHTVSDSYLRLCLFAIRLTHLIASIGLV